MKQQNINLILIIICIVLICGIMGNIANLYSLQKWQTDTIIAHEDELDSNTKSHTALVKALTQHISEEYGVEGYSVVNIVQGRVTCYNSMVEQCDNDPWITASNHHLKEGDKIVANNYYAFGTKVEIDNVIYEVQDRMNARYGKDDFDIWFGGEERYEECLEFGTKNMVVKILE